MRKNVFLFVMFSLILLALISCSESNTSSDNEPPTVAITDPADNSEFEQGTIVTITVEANDNKGIKKVNFYIDDNFVYEDEEAPYVYEWNTGNTRDSEHTIQAEAFDNNENCTISALITVTLTDPAGIVTDIDGNVYQTIIIGNQEWMAENLKVTHYRNGDPILHITDNGNWLTTTDGAYSIYDNDSANVNTFGNLYNWYAIDDARGLAPEGWHVPSDEEIKQLEMYLGMTQSQAEAISYRGTNEGSKLAGNANLWNDGSLENDPEFGSSGFNLLPGGYREINNGDFIQIYSYGHFWSTTEEDMSYVWTRGITSSLTQVYRYYNSKHVGYSVRCVRD